MHSVKMGQQQGEITNRHCSSPGPTALPQWALRSWVSVAKGNRLKTTIAASAMGFDQIKANKVKADLEKLWPFAVQNK